MPSNPVTIEGFVDRRFKPVRDAFLENFTHRGEVGAAVCIYEGGEPVVDLWAGEASPGRPWQEDTISVVFSVTKGVTTVCALQLVDDGLLELDAPVAQYWPEFAAAGKEAITIRQLLSHQAGLPAFARAVRVPELADWDRIVSILAAQAPEWEPGTRHGYHALTWGWLVGEVIRRVSGLTPGAYLRQCIAPVLGLDMWIGLPPSEEHRCSTLIPAAPSDDSDPDTAGFVHEMEAMSAVGQGRLGNAVRNALTSARRTPARGLIDRALAARMNRQQLNVTQRAFGTVISHPDDMNLPRLHQLELPAGNGICEVRSLAKLYAGMVGEVDGLRVVSPGVVEEAATPVVTGMDAVLLTPTSFGLGFMVPGGFHFGGWGERTFGHTGAGGSIAFGDLGRGLSFAYSLNRLTGTPHNERAEVLIEALYDCVSTRTSTAPQLVPEDARQLSMG